MRVLGIDPGSETLGWGVVEGTGSKYAEVDFGTVKASTKLDFSKRLLRTYNGVADVIEQFERNVLSLADTFYAKEVSVAIQLGQLRGVIRLRGEVRGLCPDEDA